MKIFQGTCKELIKGLPIPMLPIFEGILKDWPGDSEIKDIIGGPVYLLETAKDVDNIRLTSPSMLAMCLYKDAESCAIEYAQWSKHKEYLLIVDVIRTSGAPCYIIPAEFVSETLLGKLTNKPEEP